MRYKIDDKDWKILSVLQEHGDHTSRQIAKKTGLPATTIHHRIKRLKQEGIIRKFTIDLDPKKTDRSFKVYILISVNLELLKQKKKTQYDIADEIRKFHFTATVDIVSGGTDLVAVVNVKDVHEYDTVLLEKLQMVEGIENTQSLIVIHGE